MQASSQQLSALPSLPEDVEAVRRLLSFVTRLPSNAPAWDFDASSGTLEQYMRSRDESNEEERKMSAGVAKLMENFATIKSNSPLLLGLRPILLDLSMIFHPSSNGCFNHWAQIFEVLLKQFPQQVYALLTTKTTLLAVMLNYVHEGAVYEQLRSIVAMAGKQEERKADETLRRLADRRLLHLLVSRLTIAGDPRAQPAADLFAMVIPDLLQQAEGDRLLRTIDDELLNELTRPLLVESAPRTDIEPALTALRVLLYYCGRKLEEPSATPQGEPRVLVNFLEPLQPSIRTATLKVLPCILRRLVHPQQPQQQQKQEPAKQVAVEAPPPADAKQLAPAKEATNDAPAKKALPATAIVFSAYKVREPFSSYRFNLLAIIVEMARKPRPEEKLFDKLDVEFWRALVGWFFDYPHNNMLHCMFYRLFIALVQANHEPSLRALLSKGKLLSRMINAYNDKSIDSRAFILAMANVLRLHAQTLPHTAFVADFLRAHEQWKVFLPLLLKESAAQQPHAPVQANGVRRTVTPQLSPAWRRLPLYNAGDGLDLGSSFSKALGVGTDVEDEVIELGGRAPSGESDDATQQRRPVGAKPQQPFRSTAATRKLPPSTTAAPAAVAPPPAASTETAKNQNAKPTSTTPAEPLTEGASKKKKKKKKKPAAATATSTTTTTGEDNK